MAVLPAGRALCTLCCDRAIVVPEREAFDLLAVIKMNPPPLLRADRSQRTAQRNLPARAEDLGQELAGRCCLCARRASAGSRKPLRHGRSAVLQALDDRPDGSGLERG